MNLKQVSATFYYNLSLDDLKDLVCEKLNINKETHDIHITHTLAYESDTMYRDNGTFDGLKISVSTKEA